MPDGSWNVDAGGNWSDTTRWLNGTVPDGVDSTALLVNQITNTRTTTVNGNYTVGSISFADNNGNGSARALSANAGVSLTLAVTSGTPVIVNNTTTTVNTGALSGSQGFRLRTDLPTSVGFFNFRILGSQPIAGVAYIGNGTNDGYISLGAYGFNSGLPGRLPNITEYVFAGMTMQIYGDEASTIPQILSGNGQIYMENGAIQTFSGNASQFTGLLGGYVTSTAFPTARQFYFSNAPPTNHSQWLSSTPGTISTNQVFNYTGSAAVSSTATFRQFQFRSTGTGTITMLYANSTSVSGTLLTLGGDHSNSGGGASNIRVLRFDCSSGPITYTGGWTMGATPGTNRLEKNGAHRLTLSGSLQHNSTTNINSGPLTIANDGALGDASSSAVTFASGVTVDLEGTRNIAKGITSLTLNGNTITVPAETGANSYTCGPISLVGSNPTLVIGAGSSFAINNSAAITGASRGITKNGDGELILPAVDNTFNGNFTVNAGSLTVGKVANSGLAASWGAGTNAIAVYDALKYTGVGHSTNRTLDLRGILPTLNSAGTGPVVYQSIAFTVASYRTLTLQANAASGYNRVTGDLSDSSPSQPLSIVKTGPGKWGIHGALSYVGTTTVSEGTLNLGATPRTLGEFNLAQGTTLESEGSVSLTATSITTTSGASPNETQVTLGVNNTPITSLNGVLRLSGLLSGSTEIASTGISSKLTITTPNSNTYTGITNVDATFDSFTATNPKTSASSGKVTGDSNVTVNGTLRTGNSLAQRGRARYGGNLSFSSGSQFIPGAAA